jgi:serine protease
MPAHGDDLVPAQVARDAVDHLHVDERGAVDLPEHQPARRATVSGSVSSGSDTDFYAVTLRGAATLIATLTPPGTADYDLYVYDSAGNEIGSSINGTGAVDSVMLMNMSFADETRYVRVVYYGGDAGGYTLGLSQ